MVCQEMRDWLEAGDSRSWDNAVRGVFTTQYGQYSAYAVLSECCTRCTLYFMSTLDHGMKR